VSNSSVETRVEHRGRKIIDETVAARMLQEGYSCVQVARHFGVGRSAIRWFVIRSGVAPTFRGRAEFKFNDGAFDTISDESAYWLGYLAADGNLCGNQVSISAAEPDAGQVHAFREFLRSPHKIRRVRPKQVGKYTSQPSYHFSVKSDRLAAAALTHGIVPRKSLIMRAPDYLAGNSRFWRGAVDGDGWLSLRTGAGRPFPFIGLCGSRMMCRQFRHYCLTVAPGFKSVARRADKGRHWTFGIAGNFARAVVSDLYRPGEYVLARKAALATQLIQWQPERERYILTFRGRTQTMGDWAEELGLKAGAIKARLIRGWPVEKALATKPSPPPTLTFRSVTKTIQEWSRITGIAGATIHCRVHNGWTADEILKTPAKRGNRLTNVRHNYGVLSSVS
jgi:hypothetical protein